MAASPSMSLRIANGPRLQKDFDYYEWQRNIILESLETNQALLGLQYQSLHHFGAPGSAGSSHHQSQIALPLSDWCHDQAYLEAVEAQLPGNKYTFRLPPVKVPQTGQRNEVRIAIAGDSVTQGCCGTTFDKLESRPLTTRLTDQFDGSIKGLHGWPFFLDGLLKANNQTTDYTIMNFGVSAATITPGVKFHSFLNDCRYEQLKKSMPHFVILGFGAMDSHLRRFSERKFVEAYVDFILKI